MLPAWRCLAWTSPAPLLPFSLARTFNIPVQGSFSSMPEAAHSFEQASTSKCARCHNERLTFAIRAEKLCKECFVKYVHTKVIKRLESNKIRGGFNEPVRHILLALSLGVSSVSLLHLLDTQLKERSHQGRHPGFVLHLLFIDESSIAGRTSLQKQIQTVRSTFSAHEIDAIPIQDCFKYGINIDEYSRGKGQSEDQATDPLQRLETCLTTVGSATSKADLIHITRGRLIAAFAERKGCTHIVCGDTTTRLAERTLAETAKGRGGHLPWLVADNVALYGVERSYPLRDLLRKELLIYVSIMDPPLTVFMSDDADPGPAASLKGNSIDLMMGQYFASVEESYPSIVANVVKTTAKLNPSISAQDARTCDLCLLPLTSKALDENGSNLCHGCSQTLNLDKKS